MRIFFLSIVAATAFASSALAEPQQAPSSPCAHGATRMVFGGIDPVEQTCALAIAGQTIADQAQQIVVLRARMEVMKADIAATTVPQQESSAKKTEPKKDAPSK